MKKRPFEQISMSEASGIPNAENVTNSSSSSNVSNIALPRAADDWTIVEEQPIFKDTSFSVIPSEYVHPDIRNWFVEESENSSSSSSSRQISSRPVSLGDIGEYSPIVKRVRYFLGLCGHRVENQSCEIRADSPFFHAILDDFRGHFLSINTNHGSLWSPCITIKSFENLYYANRATQRRVVQTDTLVLPVDGIWKLGPDGKYTIVAYEKEMEAYRQQIITDILKSCGNFQEIGELSTDYISKFFFGAIMLFSQIEVPSGLLSILGKVFASVLKLKKEHPTYFNIIYRNFLREIRFL